MSSQTPLTRTDDEAALAGVIHALRDAGFLIVRPDDLASLDRHSVYWEVNEYRKALKWIASHLGGDACRWAAREAQKALDHVEAEADVTSTGTGGPT